ncbi:hypothetical protein OPT61_g7664 [Boeremia exigua]|uniref:Uncharacterized protein n=1 Tax=Boeremia exigua TaxID=749465 RepID=A0ACC2I1Z3_9PLEO|nr:hypothetical protein OPT61_g7664 [Boeremia exigua]
MAGSLLPSPIALPQAKRTTAGNAAPPAPGAVAAGRRTAGNSLKAISQQPKHCALRSLRAHASALLLVLLMLASSVTSHCAGHAWPGMRNVIAPSVRWPSNRSILLRRSSRTHGPASSRHQHPPTTANDRPVQDECLFRQAAMSKLMLSSIGLRRVRSYTACLVPRSAALARSVSIARLAHGPARVLSACLADGEHLQGAALVQSAPP